MQDFKISEFWLCFAFGILFRNMQIERERKQNASRKSIKMKLW